MGIRPLSWAKGRSRTQAGILYKRMAGPETVYSTAFNLNFLLVYPNWGTVQDQTHSVTLLLQNSWASSSCNTNHCFSWQVTQAKPDRASGFMTSCNGAPVRVHQWEVWVRKLYCKPSKVQPQYHRIYSIPACVRLLPLAHDNGLIPTHANS